MVEGIKNQGSQQLKMHDKMADKLFKGLNKNGQSQKGVLTDPFKSLNLDKVGLSKDAQGKVLHAKAQFEFNFQAFREINTANGIEIQEVNFSYQASYEFLQQASGQPPVEQEPGAEVKDTLTQLQEFFSPENTAQRILDVAMSFFPSSSMFRADGDNESSRSNFADFIGNAINKGFTQARKLLGDLPEEVNNQLNKTHELVFAGLDDFIKNGIPSKKQEEGGVIEQITKWRMEFSQTTIVTEKISTGQGYGQSGEPKNTDVSEPKISDLG